MGLRNKKSLLKREKKIENICRRGLLLIYFICENMTSAEESSEKLVVFGD